MSHLKDKMGEIKVSTLGGGDQAYTYILNLSGLSGRIHNKNNDCLAGTWNAEGQMRESLTFSMHPVEPFKGCTHVLPIRQNKKLIFFSELEINF